MSFEWYALLVAGAIGVPVGAIICARTATPEEKWGMEGAVLGFLLSLLIWGFLIGLHGMFRTM